MDLHGGIAMDVKNPTTIYGPTWGYYNGCKKPNNYYETYM
jgi:hypothetical protein